MLHQVPEPSIMQHVLNAEHVLKQSQAPTSMRLSCRSWLAWMQSFAERQLRDSASSVPGGYTPPDFTTVALQHTNVKLTWDGDDDTRKKALRKKMTEDTIRDDDFKVTVYA